MPSVKSIVDTLRLISDAVTQFEQETNQAALIALIGGYAALYYGSERTTFDVDTCFYVSNDAPGRSFYVWLKKSLPSHFELRFMEASKDPTDPFKHDLITITDAQEEYPRIDIMIVRYKWELEGLEQAETVPRLNFPVIPPPYLVAMKLVAGGRKDELDILAMVKEMTEETLNKSKELAKRVHRDKKLTRLLNPPPEEEVRETPEEYL